MRAYYHFLLLMSTLLFSFVVQAQHRNKTDTLPEHALDSIIINTSSRIDHTSYLPETDGLHIYSGKKTNLVLLDGAKANLPQNLARTAFAQIPGLTIWEMDGAGTQINIGSRGTDTHRSIEMNMRQNGYNFNSDMFGYPEAHYTPPLQGIQRIELVRGSAALQFGSQFGGMMNYVMKDADSLKPIAFESEQTVGSRGFFNSFNAISGRQGRLSFYAYYDNRHGNGWRPNAAFNYHAYYANLRYEISQNASIALQFSRMDYVQQIAGGLTDQQFQHNARQSVRARNFFNPFINLPALLLHARLSARTRLEVVAHALIGERNSVQFLNTPNIPDTVNRTLNTFNPRQVDRDYYDGFTAEARLLHQYQLGNTANTLAAGLRSFTERTRRRQKGVGTAAGDFDLSLVRPYGIDLEFHTHNYAAFLENTFRPTKHLSITPGARFEIIHSSLRGAINNASDAVAYNGDRSFPLLGAGVQYQLDKTTEIYGNISQAYRPYLYANVTPADRIDIVDPNLRDTKGHDIDLGYRGRVKDILRFDVNGFYVHYDNRIGQLTLKNGSGSSYLFTTNIGDAVSKGVEAYISVSFVRLLAPEPTENTFYHFHLFNSLSYTHARYQHATINRSGTNVSLNGHWVEGVPDWINRTGLAWQHKSVTAMLNFTYVGKSYSDANNTVFNPTGATGIVPAYHLWDFNASWRFARIFSINGGVNNLADAKYFTRRINMYPGPGILPGDGRNAYVSFGIRL